MNTKKINKDTYIQTYYESYISENLDEETKLVSKFLIDNASGKVLDCGCGPVPQIRAICMPHMEELYAIDLPPESIKFVKKQLKSAKKRHTTAFPYQKIVNESCNINLPKDYILNQIKKIKEIQQADMTISLPFPKEYFDTVISLYSLGCLKNEEDLNHAIKNIQTILKSGGKLLHINTNGKNSNTTLPAYTWNGLSQTTTIIEKTLKKYGFKKIVKKRIKLPTDNHGMYRYNTISLLSAVK